ITLERSDYRFDKVQHVRAYDLRNSELRDVSLTEAETHGTKPWFSVPAERLQQAGYVVEDDSGMTLFGPDLDVLASRYCWDTHCLHLNAGHGADGSLVGLDFEPAERPRHVEIRGTLWLDSTTSELRALSFAYVNLPLSGDDTIAGGRVEFARLTTGAWVLPHWVIRMPMVVGAPLSYRTPRDLANARALGIGRRGRWRLTGGFIRARG